MELLKKIYKKEVKPDYDYFFLIGVVFLFILLRIPSLVEPDWYGDEGIYQVIGRALNSGRMLYSGIWDNKPPLLYVLYAFVNGDLFLIRLLSLVFGALSIIVFFFVARNLFQKRVSLFSATFAFGFLFGIPLLEGNIANAENFMILPILLALYLLIKLKKSSSVFQPALIGILLSVAFLTKIVALFDFIAFVFILFTLRFYDLSFIDLKHFLSRPKELIRVIKLETILAVAFLTPIFLTGLYFLLVGSFQDFFRAAFSQNVGYVGYANLLQFKLGTMDVSVPQGILILKVIALFIAIILTILFRKKLGRAGVAIYLWMLFSLFNTFFSGRPYTHYMLVSLPAFCLFFGLLFEKAEVRLKVFHVFIFIIVLLLLRKNFWMYTKITPYYANYVEFMNGQRSITTYQSFFDRITPRDYEIARFIEINTKPEDAIFLVSDSGQIYFLADKLPPGRYIVAYHISFYKDGILETQKAIDEAKPKYIIVTKDGELKNNFLSNYELRYLLNSIQIYEREE